MQHTMLCMIIVDQLQIHVNEDWIQNSGELNLHHKLKQSQIKIVTHKVNLSNYSWGQIW